MARRLKKRTPTEKFRCRKCGISKVEDDYYKTCEPDMDINGRMPVCKECCKLVVDTYFSAEGTIERGFLQACRKLNVFYKEDIVLKTGSKVNELKESGKETEYPFGIYLRLLFSGNPNGGDLTFKEADNPISIIDNSLDETNIKMNDWGKMWGKGFSKEEYEFLDEEYNEWAKDRKTLTRPDEILLQEIAHQELAIRKARATGGDTEDLIKQLQTLLKSANEQLKANKDQEDEGVDTISSIIKIMESQYPAEFYRDRGLYKDFDYDLTQYHDKHVTRAIKNFAANQKDFDFDINTQKDDDDDINFEEVASEDSDTGG
jgi:hypothetical protein